MRMQYAKSYLISILLAVLIGASILLIFAGLRERIALARAVYGKP